MNLVILNNGQRMRTTPELKPPSPNFHTAPTGRRSIEGNSTCVNTLLTAGLQLHEARTHDTPVTSPAS
ncbi:hypothetical protein TNCV_827221 [Trichonephila clavipes]|nr:hypothetical protein TNCV_827221 [Trichonephila clavipes]